MGPARALVRCLVVALLLMAGTGGALTSEAPQAAPPGTQSSVPAWDARGAGPMPWQSVSCLDVTEDGQSILLGTTAPPGGPNVVLLDGDGKIMRTAQAGQRWLAQVAGDRTGSLAHALCTMPAGRAGDFPTIYACGKATVAVTTHPAEGGWPQNLFQYGDHSNHTGAFLGSSPRGAVAVYGNRVLWLASEEGKPETSAAFPRPPDGVTVSMAVGRNGSVLVGCTARRSEEGKAEANLFLLAPQSRKPLWSRPALVETDRGVAPEKGQYGRPTLPDGRREELPQKDLAVFAPLSLALDQEDEPRRIAAADYPGWQRWIRSSATLHEENYGTRFVPTRPTVTVTDAQGKLLRRFGPENFPRPQWVDLLFFGGGKYLLAYPHHWTCRGLAGQTILPADDEARSLHVLEIDTGKVHTLDFPDAISDVAAGNGGPVAVGCWNGRVYLLDEKELVTGHRPAGIAVGGPSLLRVSRDGARITVATTGGGVRRFDRAGKERWRTDLNRALKPNLKPWVANARAEPLGPGVWQLPGGRVESDLGGQRVIEAPDGLILLEAHAGLSFEREWAAMRAVGLDPQKVKYVLATHEHGDHAPGAYLWRVATGARFVCSEEMAYTLQHHAPMCSGYGLHPPNPTDIRIKEDTELDLAGLKVQAVRIPGHTFGSMAWVFTRSGRKYVSFGDLIMPDGRLGYAGSINFSARDVLSSLRKLQALKPDFALPGHGPTGDPQRYLAAGIDVGVHVGWGKMRPERPDPYFRVTQKNVQVVAWNIDATSADFGDIDGDGRPDIAVVAPDGDGAVVKLFLNRDGKFRDQPDHVIRVPQVASPNRIRLRRLSDPKTAAILVGGKSSALLLPTRQLPDYRIVPLALADANQLRRADLRGDALPQIAIGSRFGGFQVLRPGKGDGFDLVPMQPAVRGPYADFQVLDLNGDGRPDLVTSSGAVYLRQPDGSLPATPTLQLAVPDAKDWTFLAVGDFNADGRPDIALLAYGMQQPRLAVFYNTGKADRPFPETATATIDLARPGAAKHQPPLLRDAPVVVDWNGDGVADLVIGKGQDDQVLVLLGGKQGLDLKRSQTIALEYRLHYETGLHVADFNGDGVPDLACFGYTSTGVGLGGPPAVYIWAQPRNKAP